MREVIFRCILIIVNICAFVIGLTVTICGALLAWGQNFIGEHISGSLTALTNSAEFAERVNERNSIDSINEFISQYASFLKPVGIAILLVGFIILFIGGFGLFGTCLYSKKLLISYCICMSLITLTLIVAMIIVGEKKQHVKEVGENFMRDMIKKSFVGLFKSNAQTVLISKVMDALSCCGVKDYHDFNKNNTPRWNRIHEFNGTKYTLEIPVACCKLKPYPALMEPIYQTCFTNPDSENSNMNTGCSDKLQNFVRHYSTYIITVAALVCISLIILIVITALVLKSFTPTVVV